MLSGGLAVNLAVIGGTLNWHADMVGQATMGHAGDELGDGSDRHRTPVRRHEHTQVPRSLPKGKRRHSVLGDC
jgi:hypothetical protein